MYILILCSNSDELIYQTVKYSSHGKEREDMKRSYKFNNVELLLDSNSRRIARQLSVRKP